jgi:large subunit ribosomal protein L31
MVLHLRPASIAGLSDQWFESQEWMMKQGIHPESYREVIFRDVGADVTYKIFSTAKTDRTIKWEDGKEYPLVELDVSAASHPYYTGKQRIFDAGGRVERFKKRYAQHQEAKK